MTLDQARQEAASIAKAILAGEIDEYNGAMKIWKEILDKLDGKTPDDLWIFKSNANAIEDYLCNAQNGGSNNDVRIAKEKLEIKLAAKTLLLKFENKGKQ